MLSLRVDNALFIQKIQQYQRLTGKAVGDVVKEQARLLAERLTKLTFPTTKAQGRKRIAIDIGKVYLGNKWFEEVFQFRNKKLGDRVKQATINKDQTALEDIFRNSPQLSRIHIEPFDKSRHAKLRKDGRIKIPSPFSFPLNQQSDVKSLVKEKQANVGLAKRGWANCVALLGKSVPSWLSAAGAGQVVNESGRTSSPFVVLSNKVGFFSALDARANIVSRALEGRGRDMIKSAEAQLRRAAKEAGLS